MKNIQVVWAILCLCGCHINRTEYAISLQPHPGDTMKMECFYTYDANLSQDAHGGKINRTMNLDFNLNAESGNVNQTTFQLTPTRLQMFQNIPGSGLQSIDTDKKDSSTGYAARMTLQQFEPMLNRTFILISDSLANITDNRWNAAVKRSGISDLYSFFENHPIHIGLDDGVWYSGKTWKNEISFTEAGIEMKGHVIYTVDSCNNDVCILKAEKKITPPEKHQDFSLSGKIVITGDLKLSRKTGMIEYQLWKENVQLEIKKEAEIIPVKIKRTCGYRTRLN